MKQDNIFTDNCYNTGFKFDKNVVDVFDDMLVRSVPFYIELQNIIINLSNKYHQKGTNIYDLGCSLGTTCFNLTNLLCDDNTQIIGIDNSLEMINEAKDRLARNYSQYKQRINFYCKDILSLKSLENASVVISNLTLQFIKIEVRLSIVQNIYNSLKNGGLFILTEKIRHEDTVMHNLFIEQYYDYKKHNGYTDKEIENKRIALENFLVPQTIGDNIQMLKNAGFSVCTTIFQWYNFACFIAIK